MIEEIGCNNRVYFQRWQMTDSIKVMKARGLTGFDRSIKSARTSQIEESRDDHRRFEGWKYGGHDSGSRHTTYSIVQKHSQHCIGSR